MGGHRVENMFRLVGGGLKKQDRKWEDIWLKMCSGSWEEAWKKLIKMGGYLVKNVFRLVGGSLAPPDAHISAQHIADQH